MRNYSDPTANVAIASVDREIKRKKKLADKYKELYRRGLLDDEALIRISNEFTGIFSNIYYNIFKKD